MRPDCDIGDRNLRFSLWSGRSHQGVSSGAGLIIASEDFLRRASCSFTPMPVPTARSCLRKTKKKMNKTILSILAASITAAVAVADEVKTTTTTIGNGTITEYAPGSTFVVKETSGPVTYRYGKKVTYVTRKGTTLSDDEVRTRIKVGAPVHVHYDTDGDARVISRVELDED
jgi:hypothetical protein